MRAATLLGASGALIFAALIAGGTSADTFGPPTGLSIGMYASTCPVTVTSSTPTSCFCPVATDPQSAVKRTIAPNPPVGKAWRLEGGGVYSVPAANTLSADIAIKVGSATVMSITTAAAPVASNAGVTFNAICSVRSATTINCQGMFAFVVLGGTYAPVAFSQTATFDPSVPNVIDVLGDWNGSTSTHSTRVDQAVLTSLN